MATTLGLIEPARTGARFLASCNGVQPGRSSVPVMLTALVIGLERLSPTTLIA